GLVWFVEKSFPRFNITGSPLLAGPSASRPQDRKVEATLVIDDFGWRRPDDFLKLPVPKGNVPLAIADADKKRKELTAKILAQRGQDTAGFCKPVDNPLSGIKAEGAARFRARGIDADRLGKMKAILLTGSYAGAGSKN